MLAHPSCPRRLAGVALALGLATAGVAAGAIAPATSGVALASPATSSTSSSTSNSTSDSAVIGGPRLAEAGVVVEPGLPPLPATTATSFIVADADTGDVLAALNAHQRLAPASTLKTLTALTLIPRLKPAQPVTAQRDAPNVDGTTAGIVAGTTYKVSDLFTAMLMMSANDAAVALADAYGGLDPTLAAMNAEAAYLNAGDTVARTPNGLDAPGQSSSAYDLALIFRAGLRDAQFRQYLALRRAAFPAPGGASFQIQTHDRLLNSYPGMVGGKNGYTVAAQASYVGAATREGHTIIVAVMRDQPSFWSEVQGLLDWGFAAEAVQPGHPVGGLVPAGPAGRPAPPSTSPDSTAAAAGSDASGGVTGGGRAAAGVAGVALSAASPSDGGFAFGRIAMWGAVGFGALFFLAALGQLMLRRRRRLRRDQRYLAGLSRLSSLGHVSDRP
jgi:D-alanyl-D-alanine carboxypeptidase (penicillin-binding protein 5/6)